MRTLMSRTTYKRVSVCFAAIAGIAALCVHAPARAQTDYDVTFNTASLAATGAILTFDLIAGGGTQSNSVMISDFSSDGTLVSGGVNSGSVTGSLSGGATLSASSASFFNELQQGMTLGNTISFQVDATTNAPSSGSLPDTLSIFLLNPRAPNLPSLTTTGDPTGADSLLTLQIGSTGDNCGEGNALICSYRGSGPPVPVTYAAVTAPTTVPEIDASTALSALTLLMGGLAVLRGRRIAVSLR
jgi:hypothetical protein